MMAGRQPLSERLRLSVNLCAVFLTFAASTLSVAQGAGEEVVVDDPRPLAAAIAEFAKRCDCAITYEDVKWTPDQVEISPTPTRLRPDGSPWRRPNGRLFRFFVPPQLAQTAPAEIGQSFAPVLRAFEESRNSGEFKLIQGRTALHVLPARSALLERRVSVSANDITAGVAVRSVIAELTRTSGEKVGIWSEPINGMLRPIRVTTSNEPAYEALSRILHAVERSLSWRLVYDVNAAQYFMIIYGSADGPRSYPQ